MKTFLSNLGQVLRKYPNYDLSEVFAPLDKLSIAHSGCKLV